MNYKKMQKGFTLIELLVVIAIIGTLSVILFIAINPAEQSLKAKSVKIAKELKDIKKAMLLTEADTGQSSYRIGSANKISYLIENDYIKYLPNSDILSTLDTDNIRVNNKLLDGIWWKIIRIYSNPRPVLTDHDKTILTEVDKIINKSSNPLFSGFSGSKSYYFVLWPK